MQDKTRYTFSGHESFYCKSLWLKKGYDFVSANKNFNNPGAVVDLGVLARIWLQTKLRYLLLMKKRLQIGH